MVVGVLEGVGLAVLGAGRAGARRVVGARWEAGAWDCGRVRLRGEGM